MMSTISLLQCVCLLLQVLLGVAAAEDEQKSVQVTIDGQRYAARDDRRPALYTADFGDCLGASVINVTRFDAAYYKDNMTILFHLQGETALIKQDVMMSIAVYAYGETRFELTFNPCDANIWSACPMQANTSIEAAGIIPVNRGDVSGVPDIALSIPDFEGQAVLRIFSNLTEAQIGCFAAQITNGNSFRRQLEVGSTLGGFTIMAAFASLATTIYGDDVVEMRKHYAHSPSLMVIFAVWHHIYFSGALSMNWPSILVAFWSNYAWSAGMMYSEQMQNTINDFIGSNKGNISQVGAAGSEDSDPAVAGIHAAEAIYKRPNPLNITKLRTNFERRDSGISATSGFHFNGRPMKPGLPLPGTYSGFSGLLAQDHIPVSNAFTTGLFWFLVLVAGTIILTSITMMLLEASIRAKVVREDRFQVFRKNFITYTMMAILRLGVISFFMVTFLSLFQLSCLPSLGPSSIAVATFLLFVLGIGAAASLSCYNTITGGLYVIERDRLDIVKVQNGRFVPRLSFTLRSAFPRVEGVSCFASLPIWRISRSCESTSIHGDVANIKKCGWILSRYRRTRWWFFITWLLYELVRASFLAGFSSQSFVQVCGLLTLECLTLGAFTCLRPFEGHRMNLTLVFGLGISKVSTTALSLAFDARFNLSRMQASIIGFIIIVIQGMLTVAVLFVIASGVVTTFMSLTRDRDQVQPSRWAAWREKYLEHINSRSRDMPSSKSTTESRVEKAHAGPYFAVNHVKRVPKIEDEDSMLDMSDPFDSSRYLIGEDASGSMETLQRYRTRSSVSRTSLPPAARLVRPSWNSEDFRHFQRPESFRLTREFRASTPLHFDFCTTPKSSVKAGSLDTPERCSSPVRVGVSRTGWSGPLDSVESLKFGTSPGSASIRMVTDTEDEISK